MNNSTLLSLAALMAALIALWYLRRLCKATCAGREYRNREQEGAFTVKVTPAAIREPDKPLVLPDGVTEQWFRHAYPLTQIVINATFPPGSDVSLMTDVLRDIHSRYNEQALCTRRAFGCGTASVVSWTCEETLSVLGPSFFDDHGGTLTAGWVFEREQERHPQTYTDNLCVVLQRIRPGQMNPLTGWLSCVEEALEAGKTSGRSDDDDNGWAFRLTRIQTADAGGTHARTE